MASASSSSLGFKATMPSLSGTSDGYICDLREHNLFHLEILDQGFCRACWAIVAAATSSGLMNYSNKAQNQNLGKPLIRAAPQELVDCLHRKMPPKIDKDGNPLTKTPDRMGCLTSSVNQGFRYTKTFGLALEENYPFIARRNDRCLTMDPSQLPRLRITGLETAVDKTEEQILAVIRERPIAGALLVTGPLRMFVGQTIYDGSYLRREDQDKYEKFMEEKKKCLKEKGMNYESKEDYHAVLIVRYGTENGVDYYLIMNSWGKKWGNQGFAKVRRDLFPWRYFSWPVGAYMS